jgi:hypothetical protein
VRVTTFRDAATIKPRFLGSATRRPENGRRRKPGRSGRNDKNEPRERGKMKRLVGKSIGDFTKDGGAASAGGAGEIGRAVVVGLVG